MASRIPSLYPTVIALLFCLPWASTTWAEDKDSSLWLLPAPSFPADNPDLLATRDLGQRLFYDPRLSMRQNQSCASCHNPGLGWSSPTPPASTQAMDRDIPTLINAGYYSKYFWDGRKESLEAAITDHMREQGFIAGNLAMMHQTYQPYFKAAFASGDINIEGIAKALANFIRHLNIKQTPFDQWQAGDEQAISEAAKRGYVLFQGKARCVSCHQPPLFSDSSFHNIGLNMVDPGRVEVSGDTKDMHAFRTPALRQIALTAPYMHTGNLKTLRKVIRYYRDGGDRANNELQKLNISDKEANDLLQFLLSLSITPEASMIPSLPMEKQQ